MFFDRSGSETPQTIIWDRRDAAWVARQLARLDAPVTHRELAHDLAAWKEAAANASEKGAGELVRAGAEQGLAETKKALLTFLSGADMGRSAARSIAKSRARTAEQRGAAKTLEAYRLMLALDKRLPRTEDGLPYEQWKTVRADNPKTKHRLGKGVMAMALPGVGKVGALAVAGTTRTKGTRASSKKHARALAEVAQYERQGYEVVDVHDYPEYTEWTLRMSDDGATRIVAALAKEVQSILTLLV